jgi:hypothetical protein
VVAVEDPRDATAQLIEADVREAAAVGFDKSSWSALMGVRRNYQQFIKTEDQSMRR